jgi:hypothetical protein
MLLALFTTFAASRKEPLVDAVERVHSALAAAFGEPTVRFALSDAPGSVAASVVQEIAGIKRVSSIARVLKRRPELERFARTISSTALPGASTRVMSNLSETGTVEAVDFAVLKEIARGVPKSFPFHGIKLHFSAPGFSSGPELPAAADARSLSQLMRAGVDIGAGHPTSAGISVQDSWWVNGRQRSIAALRIVEADPSAKKLPPPPPEVASVFAACGKVRKTIQLPLVIGPVSAPESVAPSGVVGSQAGEAIQSVVRAYRARMPELLDALPHDLPHRVEDVPPATLSGVPALGPKKPELVRAFAPLGYDCRGETGTFTLRRRTTGNLTVELKLDVGTWSHAVMAFMKVVGMVDGQGFKATLLLPVSRQASHGQFPIGGPERWRQIVDNLAHLVDALDRSFVPEVEAIAGPSPEWFRSESA